MSDRLEGVWLLFKNRRVHSAYDKPPTEEQMESGLKLSKIQSEILYTQLAVMADDNTLYELEFVSYGEYLEQD